MRGSYGNLRWGWGPGLSLHWTGHPIDLDRYRRWRWTAQNWNLGDCEYHRPVAHLQNRYSSDKGPAYPQMSPGKQRLGRYRCWGRVPVLLESEEGYQIGERRKTEGV